jgi:hypothetical protein
VNSLDLDKDIKIAGDKPSRDVILNKQKQINNEGPSKELSKKAKDWGKAVALKFIEDAKTSAEDQENFDGNMVIQRRMLLSFTATVGFDEFSGDTLGGIAEKSFIDTLKEQDKDIYATSGDTGAFSFYYLAFRRGGEIDRRIGQTFAMLCSHDGDPVYQELGEALYCWFLSVVKREAKKCGILD